MRVEPTVNRLENEIGEQLQIIRINIQSTEGKVLAERYNFEFTPTFIYFDSLGNERWRQVGNLSPEKVKTSLIDQNGS